MVNSTHHSDTEVHHSGSRLSPVKDSEAGGMCRFCGSPLLYTFVDLGTSPLCESYRSLEQLNEAEAFYPLRVFVCDSCFLVQLQEYVSVESIFSEYAYFSSFSESWLAHARRYTEAMIERWSLGPKSQVIELASNDGYLLQYFVLRGIPALGVEPAANVAAVALKKGICTVVEFFGRELASRLASEGKQADLLLGNNVLAQVPDLNGFVAGMKILLKSDGVITLEFPHLFKLMKEGQFDTIYHEHFSYFSFLTVEKLLARHDLAVFDVERLSTHGGSLRIFACHAELGASRQTANVAQLRDEENEAGLGSLAPYGAFAERVCEIKYALLSFLIRMRRSGKQVVGYGAPGKGNTLLNYCGIRSDLLAYTVDRNPYKQGKFLPGSHIPIFPPDRIRETKPDFVLILPWNLQDEIRSQLEYIREWGGKFVVPIPEVRADE